MKLKRILALLVCFTLMLTLAACGGNENSNLSEGENDEMVTVRFGILPYQDWMPWLLADELGYFADEGIELEIIKFPDDITCAEGLAAGDVDVACGNSGSGPLVLSRFQDMRIVSLTCGFLGYSIMVRPDDLATNGGDVKTYEMIYEELIAAGQNEAEANENAIRLACEQLKGKEIVMDRGTGSNMPLAAALEAGGLMPDEVNYIDIQDVEGALAFWDGTGDFELGAYPQAVSLTQLGAKPLISSMQLGGKSVILSDEMAMQDYIDNNQETLIKLRKAWYRVIDDIYSEDEAILQRLADITNEWQGSTMDVQGIKQVAFKISPWPQKDSVMDTYFTDDSQWNAMEIYNGSLDFWADIKEEVERSTVDLERDLQPAIDIHKQL